MSSTTSDLISQLNPTPEERLLVICARLELAQNQRDELIALLAGLLDWEQVLHKAQWHDLAALVFHHLRGLDNRNQIPAQAMGQLKATYVANVARNLYFQAELRRALEVLKTQEIPVILLKGAALAGTVYEDVGLRPMSDLDLLVPEELVHTAQAAVRELGYRPVGSQEEQDDTEQHHQHMPGLVGVGKPVLFEIHRHIVRRDSVLHFNIDGFWSRAQEVSLVGTGALVLAPEDLLIHLSLNFFLDRRFRSVMALRQLCDIAASVGYYQGCLCWQLLTDKVQEDRLTGPVGCALYSAQQLLGAQIPGEVVQQLWPGGLEATQVKRFLRRRVLDTRPWVARALASPGSNYRPGQVAMASLHHLIPSRSYMARQYNQPALEGQGHLLYFKRVWEGLLIFFRAATRPHELKEDLALDRWHHSLYPVPKR